MDSLSTAELKRLSAKAESLYGVSNISHMRSTLEYEIDDGAQILDKYYTMNIIKVYVMIAVSIVLAVVVGILFYNTISIIINAKASDLLILKSLGASKIDYLKIYGIFTAVQLLIELVVGIGFGIGGVYLLNQFIVSIAGMGFITALPLMPIALLVTVLIAVVISGISLTLNICSISDKNLRKAFQKVKE